MTTRATVSTGPPAGQARISRLRPRLALCFLLPFLMGGCPEFRNDIVSVFETATRSALLGTADEQTITDTVTVSLVNATIDLLFDQFRDDEFN